MQFTKTNIIFIYIAFTLLIIITFCINLRTDAELICESARYAFTHAIDQEKHQYISRIEIYYNNNNSPNDISGEEKKNWCDQAYFFSTDSTRHRLDSLFRNEMLKVNAHTVTAIGYKYNGKNYHSLDEKFIRKATLIQEYKYRKDYNNISDITLRAYIYTPLYILILNNIYTYILLCVLLFPIAYLFYYRYKKANYSKGITVTDEAETNNGDAIHITQRKYKTTKWVQIYEGYYWDGEHNILRYKNKNVMLNGKAIRIFHAFITKEDFFLFHHDIYKIYNLKVESPETKDKVYYLIKSLKESLSEININIESVRGKGYKLSFNVNSASE